MRSDIVKNSPPKPIKLSRNTQNHMRAAYGKLVSSDKTNKDARIAAAGEAQKAIRGHDRDKAALQADSNLKTAERYTQKANEISAIEKKSTIPVKSMASGPRYLAEQHQNQGMRDIRHIDDARYPNISSEFRKTAEAMARAPKIGPEE
jgi:hypothetical protein